MSNFETYKWTVENLRLDCGPDGVSRQQFFNFKQYPSAKFVLVLVKINSERNEDLFSTLALGAFDVTGVNHLKFWIRLWREDTHGKMIKEQTCKLLICRFV
jgi:hypothetical protein